MKSKAIVKCQGCGSSKLYKFINFGQMPLTNIYLTKEQIGEQKNYQLGADVCTRCGMVQLDRHIPSKDLFGSNYAYRTPEAMRDNFREAAKETIDLLNRKGKVLEVGGGIGIALQEYKKLGFKVLGVDPAKDCAKEANKNGIRTLAKPFTLVLAKELVRKHGKFDIVTAANVLQHIPNIRSTIEGISEVLAEDGIFTLEFPYLDDILKDLAFDTFYGEHYYYLSLLSLQRIFSDFGMVIFHAKRLPSIHLGSMRIFVKHFNYDNKESEELTELFKQELEKGFLNPQMYKDFSTRIDSNMHQLQEHLYIAKIRGDRIVAHGSSAKFVTLTNYGHIGSDVIEYVADSTKFKQGLYTPGMGIPVVSEEKLLKDAPDLIVCGIRNFYESSKPLYDKIKKKNPKCKILIPIPEIKYV